MITALIFLFQLKKYRIVEGDFSTEIVISIVSVVFFFIGIYFKKSLTPASALVVNQSLPGENKGIDYAKVQQLGISNRELEVIQELVKGSSNKEISEKLFISESTTKTHLSNLFTKLEVKNRSQAIIRSNELNLVDKTQIGTLV